jgi:Glycosyl transferases group 1
MLRMLDTLKVGQLQYLLGLLYRKRFPKRIYGYYQNGDAKPKGSALFSYLVSPLRWSPDDKRFWGHSNKWECAEIAKIFNTCGYSLDAIEFDDKTFTPRKKYDIVFDIHGNLQRYAEYGTTKILYTTGSYPRYSNAALDRRLAYCEKRKGVRLLPRRAISLESVSAFDESVSVADSIIMIGTERTKATMPLSSREKIHLVPVTASYLPIVRSIAEFEPRKEFLWFGGAGAIHKGLDLVLEVFQKNRDLILHVIGPCELYKHELHECANIKAHGFVYPNSERFRTIVEHVIAFIYPSCSESISTAAVTCMQYGMIPIVSNDAGIELAQNEGIVLSECSVEHIERSVAAVASKKDSEIKEMSLQAQETAKNNYSRERYSAIMERYIRLLTNSTSGKTT